MFMKIRNIFPSIKSALFLLMALTLTLSLACQARAEAGLDNFQPLRTYEEGFFEDVPANEWYAASVAEAYELGLFNGEAEHSFVPGGKLTTVEAVTLAARMHSIYYTGSEDFIIGRVWYESYVQYALDNGIIDSRYDITSDITRARFADIFSRALPKAALPETGTVLDDIIPDVKSGDEYAGAIYLLYRAGILTGNDNQGTFFPDSTITRAEAAAIVTRMANPALRKSLTLIDPGPDVPEQPEADDAFFANSAILGNSLVDGLKSYSGLKTLNYFCKTSMSVDSVRSSDAWYVQSLCSGKYDRIYIELGINEISYPTATFISRYTDLLDKIIAAQPGAEIYLISVLPVTRAISARGTYTMTRVNAYNEALYDLAAEKNCRYLDVCSALATDDGYLPSGSSWDGIHFQPSGYKVWENYMRTHY